ncbi:MAG TPA: ArsC family reductase [Chitinophagaceae bacterium]|nr:ArsC family reductase [Chitinophagaceae bacterium]
MLILYGIPNCDTVKKARTWLDQHKISYQFHDFKQSGIEAKSIQRWIDAMGIEIVLNKKSTTWRGLDATQQASASNTKKAIQLMQEHTSLIKRPVLEKDGQVLAVGFDAAKYSSLF